MAREPGDLTPTTKPKALVEEGVAPPLKTLSRALPVAICSLAVLAPTAATAAPASVNLRVEGPTKTLFEGPVTTDVRTFRFTGDPDEHQCDATTVGGTSATPQPTRNVALATASEQHGFAITGSWHPQYGVSYATIAGENVGYANNRFLSEFRNWTPASNGGCADPMANGEEVLFAYTDGAEPLLKLTGPATAKPGVPFAVKVVDGATSGAIAGAAVGGATSDGAGDAAVTLSTRGTQTLKAEKPGTVRSNALTVCVSDGADGYCGSRTPSGQVLQPGTPSSTAAPFVPDRTPPRARVSSIRKGQVFSRGKAPKLLKGKVAEDGSVLMVKVRLTRNDNGRCSAYSAKRERWIRREQCGADEGWWFKVGDRPDWEYQLASKLPRGRYVLDVNVIDKAYNRDDARRPGENRVVFTVK
jgi:hypothetical protein